MPRKETGRRGHPRGVSYAKVRCSGHLPRVPSMPHSEPQPALIPTQSQPLIAGGVVLAVVAMAVWFLAAGGLSGGLVHYGSAPPGSPSFTVNLNAAGAMELAQLPGLGPATAQRIVAYRRDHGPFASHDELLDVPGIGPVTLESLRPYLRPIRHRREEP
jgi:competence ComEA-like helix-hairpin-helix protein